MESTYGDRLHRDGGNIEEQLESALNQALRNNGNVVIPTFAVERAQELMYYISTLVHDDRIPDVKVFLDSPMAVDVTDLFRKYRQEFDEETWVLMKSGKPPLHFPGLTMSRSTKTIDRDQRLQAALHHHVHVGYVHGRPDQTPFKTEHLAAVSA